VDAPHAEGQDDDDRLPVLEVAFPDATVLGRELIEAHLTIAVAESCTGGLLGAALTAVAGSSAYVRGGVIAYADDVKAEHLGVGRHLLATHGAVSPEVAGPDSSEHKQAGLVFVAVVGPAWARGVRLDEDRGRELNRAHAVRAALRLCRVVVRAMSGPTAAIETP
jgi:nicotinamide-nucleotide amidase